jgi:hypothetical protein
MTWAPSGHRGRARHAPAFAKDGTRYMVPPLALCTGREGRIETILPERIDCKRCLAKLASKPSHADRESEDVWLAKHGIGGRPRLSSIKRTAGGGDV